MTEAAEAEIVTGGSSSDGGKGVVTSFSGKLVLSYVGGFWEKGSFL